jgi:hypothetical protein
MVDDHGAPKARLTLDVDQRYIKDIPANIAAQHPGHHGVREQVHIICLAEQSFTTTYFGSRGD